MSTPHTRQGLQIHLSTALILMFAAAGMLWLNLRPPTIVSADVEAVRYALMGWPIAPTVAIKVSDFPEIDYGNDYEHVILAKAMARGHVRFTVRNFAGNFALCLLMLAAVAAATEFIIARRGVRAHRQPNS